MIGGQGSAGRDATDGANLTAHAASPCRRYLSQPAELLNGTGSR